MGHLQRICELEAGYPEATDPLVSVDQIFQSLNSLWQSLKSLVNEDDSIALFKMIGNLYEDVFLAPTCSKVIAAPEASATNTTVELPAHSIYEIITTFRPLAQLSYMNSHRHDALHTIAAWMNARWPTRCAVNVLELYAAMRPIWREYIRFDASTRHPGDWSDCFNPLGLRKIEQLHELRVRTWQNLHDSVTASDSITSVNSARVEEICSSIPDWYKPVIGACLFVQPAEPSCTSWVLNSAEEGTGRLGSRFLYAMDIATRQSYIDHYLKRSACEAGELVDITCIQGDTLNLHPIQTARVLELNHTNLDLPPCRRLSLNEISVIVDHRSQLPQLIDKSGARLLPVHLGGASLCFMPSFVRFLSLLGPGEINPPIPAARTNKSEGIEVQQRVVIGNLILRRRRWVVSAETLSSLLTGSASQIFLKLNQWRETNGIPARIFVREKVKHEVVTVKFKPQYLDFRAPLFIDLLRSIVAKAGQSIILEEMVPDLDSLPTDERGNLWATEVLIDSLAFEHSSPCTSKIKCHTYSTITPNRA